MADSHCDELSNVRNKLNSVHSGSQKRLTGIDGRILHHFACVLCNATTPSVSQHLKVLPCLHIACYNCLTQVLLKSSVDTDTNFAGLIFACPLCSYTIQLPGDGVDGLKDASFLQKACSCAEMPDTNWLINVRSSSSTSGPLPSEYIIDDGIAEAKPKATEKSLSSENSVRAVALSETESCGDGDSISTCSGGNSHLVGCCMKMSGVPSLQQKSSCDATGDDELQKQDDAIDVMRPRLQSLSADVVRRCQRTQQVMHQIKVADCDFDLRKITLRDTVSKRADYLCKLICSRRDLLLEELDREHLLCSAQYSEKIDALDAYSKNLDDASHFASAVLAAGDVSDELQTDVVARLNQLLLSGADRTQSTGDIPEITAVRVDIPDLQHEEAHVAKLFGSLVKGTLGTVDFLKSFNTEVRWPTGFVVTRGHDSILAGKAGAFAEEGQVLFYDRQGCCVHCHKLSTGHFPIDVVTTASGNVFVSEVNGCITKFSSSGCIIAEWHNMFHGASGHISVNGSCELLVASVKEQCIHKYREADGLRLATFPLQWPDDVANTVPDISGITVNSANEIIVIASNLNRPYFFTADGCFLHSWCTESVDVDLKTLMGNGVCPALVALPSAVCCDPFDNVLIADFLENCIHLVSRSGFHLGRLLTKSHGVACPNFVTLDQDGRLYVGQYGGDVLVYRYLSYVKHV